MQSPDKTLQAAGIPHTALISVVFGLMLLSFPMGAFVVFGTGIGGPINYEYPLAHLEIFEAAGLEVPPGISIGDAFAALWVLYAALFAVAVMGPGAGFLRSMMSVISDGRQAPASNHMAGAIKWFSVMVLVSALINLVQEGIGIEIEFEPVENELEQFLYLSAAPAIEEFVFRILLTGLPLFAMYSSSASPRHFLACLWRPDALDIYDPRKAFALIILMGVLFGLAHIALGDGWSHGKFTQSAAAGIILGWVYLRYGFLASLLIHWAANYFLSSYIYFISQTNEMPVDDALYHPLMGSLEVILVACGAMSAGMMAMAWYRARRARVLDV